MRRKIISVILTSIMIISSIYIGINSAVEAKQTEETNVVKNAEANRETNEKTNRKTKEENAVANQETKAETMQETESKEEEEKRLQTSKEEQETAGEAGKKASQASQETEGETKAQKTEGTSKEETSKEETNKEGTEKEEIYSSKYLVKEGSINRIPPKTSIEEFKKNIETESRKEIKIYKGETEITKGNIGTGMKVKIGEKEGDYEISVIGDITGDGEANQVELTRIIRHLIDLKGWELKGIEAESADITGDGKINLVDITKLINYIVYGKWEYEEIKTPEAPIIEIISKKEEEVNYYIEKVEIKIEAKEKEEGQKTVYKIEGDKKQEETEIKEGETITIEGDRKSVV